MHKASENSFLLWTFIESEKMKEEIIQFQKVLFLVCLIAPLVLYFVVSEMKEYIKMQERKSKFSYLIKPSNDFEWLEVS